MHNGSGFDTGFDPTKFQTLEDYRAQKRFSQDDPYSYYNDVIDAHTYDSGQESANASPVNRRHSQDPPLPLRVSAGAANGLAYPQLPEKVPISGYYGYKGHSDQYGQYGTQYGTQYAQHSSGHFGSQHGGQHGSDSGYGHQTPQSQQYGHQTTQSQQYGHHASQYVPQYSPAPASAPAPAHAPAPALIPMTPGSDVSYDSDIQDKILYTSQALSLVDLEARGGSSSVQPSPVTSPKHASYSPGFGGHGHSYGRSVGSMGSSSSPGRKPTGPRKAPPSLNVSVSVGVNTAPASPMSPGPGPFSPSSGRPLHVYKQNDKTVVAQHDELRLTTTGGANTGRRSQEFMPRMRGSKTGGAATAAAAAAAAPFVPALPPQSPPALPPKSSAQRLSASVTGPAAAPSSSPLSSAPAPAPAVPKNPLNLPQLPFSASLLGKEKLEQCTSLWSLSQLFEWCKLIRVWHRSLLIPKKELHKALVMLVHKRYSKLKISLVEDNVDTILMEFERHGCITYTEQHNGTGAGTGTGTGSGSGSGSGSDDVQYVEFNYKATVSGVLPLLSSCYSTKHNHRKTEKNNFILKGHPCYALTCPREHAKTIAIQSFEGSQPRSGFGDSPGLRPASESGIGSSWVNHWGITPEELAELDSNIVKKQSFIFELIQREHILLSKCQVLLDVYGESFRKQSPPLVPEPEAFYEDAFDTVKAIMELHRKFLLLPMMAKLHKNTKFISGIDDLYIAWAKNAQVPYLTYVDRMVHVRSILDRNKQQENSRMAQWLAKMDSSLVVKKHLVDHDRLFNGTIIQHLIGIPITLKEILKYVAETDPEHKRLKSTLKLVKKLGTKCDQMQIRAKKVNDLVELSERLVWKSSTQTDLDWKNPERTLVYENQVFKKREMWINSTSYLILLDNYLLITDRVPEKQVFKVAEKPINIKFLLVEVESETQKSKIQGTQMSVTSTEHTEYDVSDPEVYPFKVRNVDKDTSHTFYTSTAQDRNIWLEKFKEAQSNYFLKERSKEYFKVKILSDCNFALERDSSPHKLAISPKDSPIDNALENLRLEYPDVPNPLMFSRVTSGVTFNYNNEKYTIVGLNYGVWMCERKEVRNWKRILELKSVTQMSVMEDFGLLVVLADHILQYFELSALFPVFHGTQNKIFGQKLSKQNVNFFKVGVHKGSTLLFYMKTKVPSSGSHLKVMIPKLDDTSNTFSHFQEYRKFTIAECSNLTILNNSFAIHTSKGFEILSFDIAVPQSLPNYYEDKSRTRIENGNIEVIKKRISFASCKPMGLFKINDSNELLLVYNELAVICSRVGELSRYNMLQFNFRCTAVAFQENFLVVVGKNVIQVYKIDAQTCMLGTVHTPVQVLSGREITMIDDTPGHVKFAMLHPLDTSRSMDFSRQVEARRQLVFELVSVNAAQ